MLHCTSARRGGFTLIELMVVIAIIAILAALGIGGAFTVLNGQRVLRTEDFIRYIDKLLEQHWRKVVEDAKKEQESIPDSVVNLSKVGGVADRERSLVIWIKLRLMEAFPQSYAEINNPWPYSQGYIPANMRKYNASYQKALTTNTTNNAGFLSSESSACLYLALLENRGGSRLEEDKFPVNILDSDGDGIKELVDNWGNALTFIRFPIGTTSNLSPTPITGNMVTIQLPLKGPLTGPQVPTTNTKAMQECALSLLQFAELNVLNPNKTNKGMLNGDPTDPDGFLQTGNWPGSPNGGTFQTNVHVVSNPTLLTDLRKNPNYLPAATFPAPQANTAQPYFIPVILSNGSDSNLGTDDDICSWRIRPAAKGL